MMDLMNSPRDRTATAARRPSMTDVAARAGVSYQTVSRVLNDPGIVKAETRAKVEKAIAELGFTRNLAARSLKTTRTGIFGVVTDGSPLFGPATTTAAIEWAARDAGYSTLLTALRPGEGGESTAGRELLERGAEAIVVVAPHEGMLEALVSIARITPVVSVSALPQEAPGIRCVSVDQAAGARAVVQHLAERGHRSIVHLQGPTTWFDARGRVAGFEAAITEAGIDGEVTTPRSWGAGSGYEYGHALDLSALPDAIFAANDQMALGLLRALRERGVSVPDDVSVVGFDDIEGSAYFTPPLTTVRQPFADLGWAAVHLVTSDDATVAAPLLPATLVPRSSVRDR